MGFHGKQSLYFRDDYGNQRCYGTSYEAQTVEFFVDFNFEFCVFQMGCDCRPVTRKNR